MFIKRCLLALLFLLIQVKFLFCQDCIPSSPINLLKNKISEKKIQNIIENSHNKTFEQGEVDKVKKNIDYCNSTTAKKLTRVSSEIKTLSSTRKDLITYKDIDALNNRLTELRNTKAKIKHELIDDFRRISRKGLFIVLIENLPDIPPSNNQLIKNAKQILLPHAIEFLNGTYIKRLTKIRDYSSVIDIIESFTHGEMEENSNFNSKPNYARKYFIYTAEISVKHLLDSLKSYNKIGFSDELVINLETQSNFSDLLRAKNVSENDINKIKNNVIPRLAIIRNENIIAKERHDEIIEDVGKKINKIDIDIEKTENKIKDSSKKIQEICNQLNMPFNEKNPLKSAELAMSEVNHSIKELDKLWTTIKEQELFYLETESFPIEINPIIDISKKAFELHNRINRDKGQTEGLEKYSKIENYELQESISKHQTTIYREIKRIWIFPIPQDNSSFKVLVFANFKITDQKITEEKNKVTDSPNSKFDDSNTDVGMLPGVWLIDYNWDCIGIGQTQKFFVVSDFTFSTEDGYYGKWKFDKRTKRIEFNFKGGNETLYKGILSKHRNIDKGKIIQNKKVKGCWHIVEATPFPYFTIKDLIGEWQIIYDWGCTGGDRSTKIFVKYDFSFSDEKGSSGKWSFDKSTNRIEFKFEGGEKPHYKGIIGENRKVYNGKIFQSKKETGCWSLKE